MSTGVRDAELLSAGVDEVVVTATTDEDTDLRVQIGEHAVVTTSRFHTARVDGLEPDTEYALVVEGSEPSEYLPSTVRTLPRPTGRLLCTIATTNDVHFGEIEAGRLTDDPHEEGPFFRSLPGEEPYPQVMNRAAIADVEALDPDAVVVKGDLTDVGTPEQYGAFLRAYGKLGPRMRHVRGNHDAMSDSTMAVEDAPFVVDLPGVRLAVLDTVIPRLERGQLERDQLAWLDDLAAGSADPVLVFGHHHPWDPASPERPDHYFGINPDDSEELAALIGRREAIAGYFAGHTHRNRVRRFPVARDVPIVEVACVKDYPGAWAEYQIHEGGYTQVVHRVDEPAARGWAERTRGMFGGLYRDYALGTIADRCFAQPF